MKKTFSFLVTANYLLFAAQAFAACNENEFETDFGCVPADPTGFTSTVYAIGLGLIGGAALLSVMYGGYLVMTSRGNRDQLMKGRSYIFSAIAGMVLAIIGFALYQIIATNVVKIPGFG